MLSGKHVLVVGCGRTGQCVIEQLVKAGVTEISAVDAASDRSGRSKVFVAEEIAKAINPDVRFRGWRTAFDEEKAELLLKGKQVVINTLTRISDCLALEQACGDVGLVLISGVSEGWQMQIIVSEPRSRALSRFYRTYVPREKMDQIPFSFSMRASILVSEAVKVLLGLQSELANRVLCVDLKRAVAEIVAPGDTSFQEHTIRVSLTYSTGNATLEVPVQTTLRQLIERYEPEDVHVMINGSYVGEDEYDKPILNAGDEILLRRNVFLL